MERKEQTGHICRWMAVGTMAAVIIVGCTIIIGLFEWRDRKDIASKNAELYRRKYNRTTDEHHQRSFEKSTNGRFSKGHFAGSSMGS